MISSEQFQLLALWSGCATIALLLITVLGWLLKWGIRFRLVGITGFMGVLTGGLFGLGLGLFIRPVIPGALHYTRAFDTGATVVVIAVPPTSTATEVEATLQQAAIDLYSPGRLAAGDTKMLIRARAVLHPQPGVSKLVYVGQIRRSLALRDDPDAVVEIFQDQLAQLPKPLA
jgi:Protein of function (DUF2518)